MINEKEWEERLNGLDTKELGQVANLIKKLKEKKDAREDFLDLLKRWKEKFPKAKFFYVGNIWKGAYECSGDVGSNEWYEMDNVNSLFDELKDLDENDRQYYGDVCLIDGITSEEEFMQSILNTYILDSDDKSIFEKFKKEMRASKKVPMLNEKDATDLYCGYVKHTFINIETGLTYEVTRNEW